eukprot:TRINITY_DN1878_c8_g1_i1.p1 TRINITY_DN1878_c8_g1~~TRINITY_DN1878_c8_g1_i1.p1  ORF type:complete len:265 (+),score=32.40 TRINITY_DN1878_c8_g1_i1:40-834(+)
MSEPSLEVQIKFARAYPFPRPPGSFVFRYEESGEGETERLDDWSEYLNKEESTGIRRIAVLAIGSNASPQQLQRKYGNQGESGSIVVVSGTLPNYDVVYCPLIARYGSIPATLIHKEGSSVDIHVTYLTMGQLEVMTATEGGYHVSKCTNLNMKLEGGHMLPTALAWLAKNGHLRSTTGQPIPLSEIQGSNRSGPSMTQTEVLSYVASVMDTTAEEFITSVLTDISVRKTYNSRLLNAAASCPTNKNIVILEDEEDVFNYFTST